LGKNRPEAEDQDILSAFVIESMSDAEVAKKVAFLANRLAKLGVLLFRVTFFSTKTASTNKYIR
jgi:hypothetical protein